MKVGGHAHSVGQPLIFKFVKRLCAKVENVVKKFNNLGSKMQFRDFWGNLTSSLKSQVSFILFFLHFKLKYLIYRVRFVVFHGFHECSTSTIFCLTFS